MAEEEGGVLTPTRIITALLMTAMIGVMGWSATEMIATHTELVHLGDRIDATREKIDINQANVGRIENGVGEVRSDIRSLRDSVYTKTDADRDMRATNTRLQRLEDRK